MLAEIQAGYKARELLVIGYHECWKLAMAPVLMILKCFWLLTPETGVRFHLGYFVFNSLTTRSIFILQFVSAIRFNRLNRIHAKTHNE